MITLEMQTPFSAGRQTHRLPNSFRHKCRQGQYGTGSGDATCSRVESSNKGPGDEEQRFRGIPFGFGCVLLRSQNPELEEEPQEQARVTLNPKKNK